MHQPAAVPANEPERLARLRAMKILDTEPEEIFDSLARAAAEACDMPLALISMFDGDRQWFKASFGLPPGLTESPRATAFCAHTLLADELLEVVDATRDPRFAESPFVTRETNGIRFYCGVPVTLSEGLSIGVLCVLGREPKQLAPSQVALLRTLARSVAQALESRERMLAAVARADENSARITNLYRSTPTTLFSMDGQGRLMMVSDAWTTETGYTREELEGHFVTEFLTEESARFAREVGIPRFLKVGRTDNHEYQVVCKDGSLIDVLVSQVLERDADGNPLRSMSVFENITPRRKAERALRAEQERMARILEGTNAGTFEINVITGETRYNERWAQMIGYTLEELGATHVDDWIARIHPEDLPRAAALVKAHYKGQVDYFDFEGRIRHRDGHWVWVRDHGRVSERSADGKPLSMHGTHRDITARKHADDSLRESQSFLQRVGQVAGVGGWEIDLRTNTLNWSEQICLLHDVPADHRPTLEEGLSYFTPQARPIVTNAIQEGARCGAPFDLELPLVSAMGRAFWVRAVGSAEVVDGRPVRLVGAMQDITARKEAEAELARSRELLQVTLESIGDAVITTDTHGVVQWLNPVAERMTGWSKHDAVGKMLGHVFVVIDEETGLAARNPVAQCLKRGEIVGEASHTMLISRNGEEYGIEDSASPIREANGQVLGAVLVFRDVSEQRRLNNEMSHRATHDLLTGLLNRAEFETRLVKLLGEVAADPVDHSVLYIDLDQFKLVNDACGHAAGDQLLRQIAGILRSCVRSTDIVARLGGDEFGLILQKCNTECAQMVAQKICDQMEEFRFTHDARRFRVGTSIGLVPIDPRWVSVKALLQAADAACFAAKEGGRNRVHAWFDSDAALKARHGDMQWVSRIELALDEDRFELFGQRIQGIGQGSANDASQGLHFEVLLRLREPNGTLVPPGAFLPAAERFHLATRLDRWVVRNAFEAMRRAERHDVDVTMMSINLSGQSLGDRAFHRDVAEMIRSADFDVRRLCFEITETAAITHLADARTFIEEVRALGVKVALDDFGAGASSFGYLKSLPVDFLKIDGHFITNILEDELNNAAVRCFCEVARVVGVKTIAEFVEREDVCAELRTIGVDMAQGYLVHRPEPLETLFAERALPAALLSAA